MPAGVVFPKNADDIGETIRFAQRNELGLIPRASGTSLAGQCVVNGLVVDVSKHLTRILSVDEKTRRARVEPGVFRDELNRSLAPHGMFYGPDTLENRIYRHILQCTESNIAQQRDRDFVVDDPGAILVVEIRRDNRANAEQEVAALIDDWKAHSTPSDWAYGSLPNSMFQEKNPGGFRDKTGLMLDKAAIMALAYLKLHKASGEARFLNAAEAIGQTLSKRQRPNGSWPFWVDPKTEKVIEE